MSCKHDQGWTLHRRYDKTVSPPRLAPYKICNGCGENLGEFPTRVNFIYGGRAGVNDRKFVKGITDSPE